MIYILLLLSTLLCGCDDIHEVIIRNGHTYIKVPFKHAYFEHDPLCKECQRQRIEASHG